MDFFALSPNSSRYQNADAKEDVTFIPPLPYMPPASVIHSGVSREAFV